MLIASPVGIDTAAVTGDELPVLARVETLMPSLYEAERKVADYLLTHSREVVHMSITEVADVAGTSEATVLRLARKLGYRGYAPMKIALAMQLHTQRPAGPPGSTTPRGDDIGAIKQLVIDASVGSLRDTAGLLDDRALERAVEALLRARRIEVYGVGESAPIAQHAYASLIGIGLPVVPVTDPHLQVTSAVQLGPKDAALAISLTGSSRDTVEALQFARDAEATTICLTRHARAPITRVAGIVLLAASRHKPAGDLALLDRVAQLAVLEIIRAACVLRRKRGSMAALFRARNAVTSTKHF